MKIEKTVKIIPATVTEAANTPTQLRKLRVAAYCRVSTDKEEQINSYKSQIEYYTTKIDENPNWHNVGIFADEGRSGTTVKRPNFQKMMGLARRKKIDLIITKSVSRFSRNTLDCIDNVRKLRALGIGVFFESENIDTTTMDDETILTVISSLAQSESISMSKNIRMGFMQAFKAGRVHFNYGILGYRKGEDGEPEIVPEEARIVERIYHRFLAGHSYQQIAGDLEADGILTKKKQPAWKPQVIKSILNNERYTGDALCQKTYIEDPLTHKVRKNKGELPMYLVENNHPGIIDRGTFQQAQQEMISRNGKRASSQKTKSEMARYSARNALTGRMFCDKCGSALRRTKFREQYVWRCLGRMEFGVNYCPHSETVYEKELRAAIMDAVNDLVVRDELDKILLAGLQFDGREDSLQMLELMSTQLYERMAQMLNEALKYGGDMETPAMHFIQEQRDEIQKQIERKRVERPCAAPVTRSFDPDALVESLKARTTGLLSYNEDMIRQMIERVTVLAQDRIRITFHDGATREAVLERLERRGRGRPKREDGCQSA